MASEPSLGDVAEIIMGQSPLGEKCNTEGIGIPLLNGPTEYGPHHPSPVQFTTDPRKRARPGDILFCVRGSTTGRMNWADQEYAIGRGVAAIRHRTDPALQPLVRAVIEYDLPELLAQATGSTFPNVSADQLSRLWWPRLEDDEQRAIAYILGTLDDKIELNRRMNETLEAITRALFTSWFVDFDPVRAKAEGRDPGLPPHIADLFPDSFEDSELGEIPAGWSVGSVDDQFDLIMGQSPPGSTYNEEGHGLPFYQGRADFGFRFPKRRVFCTAPSRVAKPGDTLVSVRAPVGDVNMAVENCGIGRGVAAVRHRSGSRSFAYYLMRSLAGEFTTFESMGTVFGSISKKDFHKIGYVVPLDRLLQEFERLCGHLDRAIERDERETGILVAIRDTLLPKLVSGEIRVPEAAQLVEAHV